MLPVEHFCGAFGDLPEGAQYNIDRIATEMRDTKTTRIEAARLIDAGETDGAASIAVEGTVEARGAPEQRFLYLLKGMISSIQVDLDETLVQEVVGGHTVDYVKANSYEGAVLRASGPVYLTPCGQLTLLARTIGLVEAKDEKSAVKPQNWRVRRDIKRE